MLRAQGDRTLLEGFPFGILSVPGRDVGLQVLLNRAADGAAVLLILPYRVTGTNPDVAKVKVGVPGMLLPQFTHPPHHR